MTFAAFAASHGLLIRDLIADGRIHAVPTEDKPHRRNGRYRWDGAWGWLQNWRVHTEPVFYRDERATAVDWAALRRRQEQEERERAERAAAAARQAAEALKTAVPGPHPYLAAKGLPKASALVLPDGALFVPMRDVRDNALLGAQVIRLVDNEWEKKMAWGMRAKGAVLKLGRGPRTILCEGYATGLSVRAAVELLRLPVAVLVCFSAGNMVHVASQIGGPRYVAADNDASGTGERCARETGLPWCMPDVIGEDWNDAHQRAGLMAVADAMRRLLGS